MWLKNPKARKQNKHYNNIILKHIYHAHTIYCNHSSLTPNDLVAKAIENAYETLGFSEHAFSPFGLNKSALASFDETRNYIKEINDLKEKHKSKIRILCGFEVELADAFTGKNNIDYNSKLGSLRGVDYLLWSFHYYQKGQQVFFHSPSDQDLQFMVTMFKENIKSEIVNYIAHPDGFINGYGKWDEKVKSISETIIDLAVENDVILGLNINGLRQKRLYPCREFWEIANKKGAKIKLELDAHSENAFSPETQKAIQTVIEDWKIDYIDKIW